MYDSTFWLETSTHNTFDTDVHSKYDVIVVGGGITGVVSAYLLQKSGKQVLIIDRLGIAKGESAHTTAFLTSVYDTSSEEIDNRFGETGVKAIWQNQQAAIDFIESLVEQENIDCDFTRINSHVFALKQEHLEILRQETDYGSKFGLDINYIEKSSLPFPTFGSMIVKNQAKFHPLKLINYLAQSFKEKGGHIKENLHVNKVENHEDGVKVICNDEIELTTKDLIVATHYPFTFDLKDVNKLSAYNTYVVEARIKSGLLAPDIYWDCDDPYTYFRVENEDEFDRIIIGGKDHKTGHSTGTPYEFLVAYLGKRLMIDSFEVIRQWTGQIYESIDGLPFIGEYKKHHYVATGWAGNGMTYGVFSAILIHDLITTDQHSEKELYNPRRNENILGMVGQSVVTFAKEVNHVAKVQLSTDESQLKDDEGAVMRVNGIPTAVYKHKNGRITKRMASCPHLKCVVAWNAVDKTFDCPCHGSRFTCEGKVFAGPATKDLVE